MHFISTSGGAYPQPVADQHSQETVIGKAA